MKQNIMCIKAIKKTGKGNNINKWIFQFWRLYVRIRSHRGKSYTHLFVHSKDTLKDFKHAKKKRKLFFLH